MVGASHWTWHTPTSFPSRARRSVGEIARARQLHHVERSAILYRAGALPVVTTTRHADLLCLNPLVNGSLLSRDPARVGTVVYALGCVGNAHYAHRYQLSLPRFRERLAAGIGMLKVAREFGVGSGTVQRVKREMAGVRQP